MDSRDFGDRGQGGFQRPKVDVSEMGIKCRDCGIAVTELPFNPDPSRTDNIRCTECQRKWREQNPRPPRRF